MPPRIQSAEIVAVGSELLTPFKLDSNSLFLTGRLNDLGVAVHAKAIVRDHREALGRWIAAALERVDLLITTGGLGPTEDDVTREAVADVFGLPLDEHAEILDAIRARFARRRLEMPSINRRQALVPRGAEVLPNPAGTAPGLWLARDDRVIVLLPGPPRELTPMFDVHVAPRLAARTSATPLRRRVIRVAGRTESHVEEVAQPIYSRIGTSAVHVDTTILASPGLIELHLEGRGADVVEIDRVLADGAARLSQALSPHVVSDDGRTLETVVGDLLRDRGWTLAAAESCTAGLVLGRLTEVAGSSAWITGGVVAYANDAKVSLLGVPDAMIREHGAVSEPVAEAMANGVRVRLSADIGVAITGIAGPTGGSASKPVGTVVVAVSGTRPAVRTFLFGGDRAAVRTQSVVAALDMVRRAALPGE
jgi:nicotinamide-nucleotide amidase